MPIKSMKLQNMNQQSMKQNRGRQLQSRYAQWYTQGSMLLVAVILAASFAFFPSVAQAATTGWFPHLWGGGVFPGFWLTGQVTKVEDGSVTVELPNHHDGRGMMRFLSLQVTFNVSDTSLLLDEDLAPLQLSALAEGDEVVVVPGMEWGNLVARVVYAGEPKDLADESYRGQLVADNGDTLTLKNGRDGEFTVEVSDQTVWYENGKVDRPAELADDITLRVLGTSEENDQGEDVIHAVVITPER